MYLFFYTLLVVTAFLKYSTKRKLCTATNLKIFILSYCLFYPLSDQVYRLSSTLSSLDVLLNPSSSTCSNPSSPLSLFSKITNDGYSLVCSKECPCSGNPILYRNDSRV